MATAGGRAKDTTTSLHLHADAANTAANESSHSSEFVSIPFDLRRLDQATAGPPSSMGVRSVVVTMSPNSERLARDTTSDDVEFAVGHLALSTGQAVLDDGTDAVSTPQQLTNPAGINRFANRFTRDARGAPNVGDNYCYDSTATEEQFGLLCNLGRAGPALDLRLTDELVLHVDGESPVTITFAQIAAESTYSTFADYLRNARAEPSNALLDVFKNTLFKLDPSASTNLYSPTDLDTTSKLVVRRSGGGTFKLHCNGNARLAAILGLPLDAAAADDLGFSDTLQGTRRFDEHQENRRAEVYAFEYEDDDGTTKTTHVLGLRKDSLYRAYNRAVADGQQVQFDAHDGGTTTTAVFDGATTTLQVTSTLPFVVGDFIKVNGAEIVQVTGKASTSLTVLRAQKGTSRPNFDVVAGSRVSFETSRFVLPSGIATANKIVDGSNKEPDTTSTAVLYARNVVVPTGVNAARRMPALMFFNTYADATADYGTDLRRMATRAVDIGPSGFTAAERAALRGVNGPLNADFHSHVGIEAVGHVLTILNRSVLELRADWDYLDHMDDDGVIKLQYVGSHAPPSSGGDDPQPIFFAKSIGGTDGLGPVSNYGNPARIQVRVVLFNTEAEARKPLSDYTVDTTADDGATTHARARAYACAKAAVRLVQPVAERASGETSTSRRHAFVEPLYASERLLSRGVQSLNHIDPTDASAATLIKLKRPTKLRGGDEVVLQPVLEGEEGRDGGPQYEFGQQVGYYAHALDPAPDGEAQYLAYTGVSIGAAQIPAEGAVAFVGAEIDDDPDYLGVRLYRSREAALAKDQRQGLSLSAYRAYAAGRGTIYGPGSNYTLQGRLRLVRRRASSTWTCLYAEIGGCSAGSAGVISTDPYVSNTGNHVVAVPRSLTNRLCPVDIELPIDAVDRRGFLKLWVVEHDGQRRRPVFPDDLERIDVVVDIHHRRAPLSEEERRRRYQAFIADVVSSWGGGDSDSRVLEPFSGPGPGRRAF